MTFVLNVGSFTNLRGKTCNIPLIFRIDELMRIRIDELMSIFVNERELIFEIEMFQNSKLGFTGERRLL